MTKHFLVVLALCLSILIFSMCNRQNEIAVKHLPFISLTDSSVRYVGKEKCITCHHNIEQTFHHTGMGQSWDQATPSRSKALFGGHQVVYDTTNNLYYKPFWVADSLFIKEYRLSKGDTTYQRTEYIQYIVGSGQHTNSHIWNNNGFLYQAPITFYTQQGIWDLAPGFEGGLNSRWNRIISTECMNCHNMYSKQNGLSENRFSVVQHGIECERCHGPGSKHVEDKLNGIIIDTAKFTDYSIVNPKKLPLDLQTELCQRCHLQGITVLNEDKSYYDFKPGMYLSEVMNVFMPRYKGKDPKFIMASHADRMKQSACYRVSKNLTCINCHNPHVTVKNTSADVFNNTCKSCHKEDNTCTAVPETRKLKSDNCFQCHMPESETLDIPHVTIHDHRIQIPNQQTKSENEFSHLECLTQKNASDLLMAEGYLMMYEAFVQKPILLDSAWHYLLLTDEKKTRRYQYALIQYYFWKNEFDRIISASKGLSPVDCNAWTAYRIGEAYYQKQQYENALDFVNRATELKSEEPDFMNKKGKVLVMLNRLQEAKNLFEQIIYLQSKYESAYSNLSYVYLLLKNAEYALQLANKALALNPDAEDAQLNKVAALAALNRKQDAISLLNTFLLNNPSNQKARLALQQLLKS